MWPSPYCRHHNLPVSGSKPFCIATIIGLAPHQLAGWAIPEHVRTELVSSAFAEICSSAGGRQSTGTVGSSADNAAAEASTPPSRESVGVG